MQREEETMQKHNVHKRSSLVRSQQRSKHSEAIIRQTNQTKVRPNSKFQEHKAVQIQEKVTRHEHESKRGNLREREGKHKK